MKQRIIVLFVSGLVLTGLAAGRPTTSQPDATPSSPVAASEDGISVYFSPGGGCRESIVQQIYQARRTIQLQAYSFTSSGIAKALLDAHKRGVQIVAVLDKSQQTAKYSGATFLTNAGIPVLIDDKHAIAHNKIVIIDGEVVITGSFKFTQPAEQSNAENLVIKYVVLHDANEVQQSMAGRDLIPAQLRGQDVLAFCMGPGFSCHQSLVDCCQG